MKFSESSCVSILNNQTLYVEFGLKCIDKDQKWSTTIENDWMKILELIQASENYLKFGISLPEFPDQTFSVGVKGLNSIIYQSEHVSIVNSGLIIQHMAV